MTDDLAISAENLGKRYVLGENTSRDLLRQAVEVALPGLSRRPERELWALRGATFNVKRGEAIGIVGRNGAGKSTLLKVLSRVTRPTTGHGFVRGRLGTLLEVGTGFQPELTGRDNIFLSGSILGMSSQEVARKYDDILAFAELGDFADTPVKRYSSGMYVRLAFAVASFLDPDVLIVDEVLAVGDAAFQRRSLSRLKDATSEESRTILFVSHNLEAVRTFCRRVLVLEHGRVVFDGPTEEGVSYYLKSIPSRLDLGGQNLSDRLNRTTGAVRITGVSCQSDSGANSWEVAAGADIKLRMTYDVLQSVPSMMLLIKFRSALNDQPVTSITEVISDDLVEAGQSGTIDVTIPNNPFRQSELAMYIWLGQTDYRNFYDVVDQRADLPLLMITSELQGRDDNFGVVSVPCNVSIVNRLATDDPG